mmetsp:Transcript_109408/g.223568  ORF Transcript_109408/g.223568 Transcript_109408/m.223568 type:complete len:247 (+) Transcript_109408:924-1664(+)
MAGIIVAMGILINSVRKTEKNAARWRPSSVIVQVERQGRTPPSREFSVVSRDVSSSNGSRSATESPSSFNQRSPSNREGRRSLRFSSTPRANADILEERRERRKARRMTRMVTAQALKYSFALLLTWSPGSLNRFLQRRGDSYFWVMLLHVIFVPMQGLLNCIVYTEPRLKQWRKDRKDARSRSRMVAERSERQNREHSDDSIPVERASGDDDSDSEDDDDFDVDEYLRSVDNQLQQQQAVTTDSM